MEDLKEEGFKGIFVASGAGLPNFMNIPGENSINIMSSNEYLTRVNLMDAASEDSDTPVAFGKNVAVIGGGNTAMDSVRTAKRLGAERAMIIYRRSEEEMPARIEEVKHAKEEGVEFLTLHNPIEYIADEQGCVKQVILQKDGIRRAGCFRTSQSCSHSGSYGNNRYRSGHRQCRCISEPDCSEFH